MTEFKGNILITGPMASGKTTLALALIRGIPNGIVIDVFNGDFRFSSIPGLPGHSARSPRRPWGRRIPKKGVVVIFTAETVADFKKVNGSILHRHKIARHIQLSVCKK
jgi:hypothetical protein